MSEFLFGAGRGRVKHPKRIQAIASTLGANFVNPKLPEGWRYWFAAEGRGFPHDRDREVAVINALEAEGLWPIPLHDK